MPLPLDRRRFAARLLVSSRGIQRVCFELALERYRFGSFAVVEAAPTKARRQQRRVTLSCAPDFFELERHSPAGYTLGMKTAVSIPDDIFERAERLARRMKKSRSELFSHALGEYVARHAPDEVTEAMNQVCAQVDRGPDVFVSAASHRILERSEW